MRELVEILQTYDIVTIMIFLLLLVVGIKWIIETVKFFKDKIENWRLKKNGEERKEKTLDQRVQKLEEHDRWQYNTLQTMQETLTKMQADSSANRVANARYILRQMAEEVLARGYMTEIEYETFKDLADVYLANKGNHTMKDKIIPQVLSLPVK